MEGQRKARQWMKRAMHLEKTNRDKDEDDCIGYSAMINRTKKPAIAGVGRGGRGGKPK